MHQFSNIELAHPRLKLGKRGRVNFIGGGHGLSNAGYLTQSFAPTQSTNQVFR